jgi:lysozyme family protein
MLRAADMATFDPAVEFTLASEGVLSDHPDDRGGRTKFGITEGTLRTYQVKFNLLRGRRIDDLTRDEAVRIYRALYWRYDNVDSQRIATKLFDVGVNAGLTAAVAVAQAALVFVGVPVTVDGLWGPQTLGALNRADEDRLFSAMVLYQADYYVDITMNRPQNLSFIRGWLIRAAKKP